MCDCNKNNCIKPFCVCYDQKEYMAVENMLRTANKEGLLVEVVLSFAENHEQGKVQEAIDTALKEWDI